MSVSRRLLLGSVAVLAVGTLLVATLAVVVLGWIGAEPLSAAGDLAQATTSAPEAQDVAGDGAVRYRVLAGALFALSLLMAGLALVYWKATTPPGKRMQRR